MGRGPNWVTFSPAGDYCCVSNVLSDDVSIIDVGRRREVARVKVGTGSGQNAKLGLKGVEPNAFATLTVTGFSQLGSNGNRFRLSSSSTA